MPGELAIITGEPVATIAEVDAPDTQAGDLVFIDGRLHNVRSALAEGGGTMKLQLALAQRTTIDLADDYIEVAVVGDPDGSAHVVALAPPRACSVGRTSCRCTGTPIGSGLPRTGPPEACAGTC